MAKPKSRPGMVLIFVPYITTRKGRRIYAYMYNKKAFAIWVKKAKLKKKAA